MKDLPSRKHYCYKIYIFLMKSNAYHLLCIDNPSAGLPRIFTRKATVPASMIFQKSQPPLLKGNGRSSDMKRHRKI